MSDAVKNCLLCQHCDFSEYERGYSEMTPGSDAALLCRKSIMRHAEGGNLFHEVYSRQQIREALATAETCPEYRPDAT